MKTLALAAVLTALLAAPAGAQTLTPSIVGEAPNGFGVFRFPQAVSYSPGGQSIVVGDEYSARINVFGPDGAYRSQFGLRASNAQQGAFGVLGGVATDSAGRIYVLDSENNRVQVFDPSGTFLAAYSGTLNLFGTQNPEAGSGISVGGIAVGPGPTVYVADVGNDRVVKVPFDPISKTFSTATATASLPIFANPQGVALDPAGTRVFVADDSNDRIVVLDAATLQQLTAFGSHGSGPGQFNAPYDVAVDGSGRLYVADNENNRVDVFDFNTFQPLATFGSGSGRGPAGQLAIVRSVGAIADNPAGGVVAADTANDRIQTFNTAGAVTAAWGTSGRGAGYVTRPRDVAFAADGSIAVADTFDDRVERFSADGAYAGQWGLVSPSSGFTTPGNALGQYAQPSGVVYDRGGQLWIADSVNDRVVELSATGVVDNAVLGFNDPRGLALDGATGDVLVADRVNNQIKRITPAGGVGLVMSGLNRPVAVASDGTNIFAADLNGVYMNSTATPVAPPPGGWVTPEGLAATPTTLFVAQRNGIWRRVNGTWDSTPLAAEGASAGQVVQPRGLALSAGGTLLVADSGNNRVLRFDPPGYVAPTLPLLSVGAGPITGGIVTSVPDGIDCVSDCAQHYSSGSVVTLTATPAKGFVLTGWGGACTGTAPTCTVTMSADRAATATFAVPPPPPPPPPPVQPAPVVVRPAVKVSRLHLSSRTLRKKNVTVSLSVSRPATLTVTTQSGRAGRRSGSRCVKPTSRLRHRARCTYYVSLQGARTLRGSGTVKFTLKRGKLKPGPYRLAIIALDASGNRVGPSTISFTVKK